MLDVPNRQPGTVPPTRRTVFLVALAFRLLLLPAGFDAESGAFRRLVLYDDDIWRYLWEGHTWFAGVNPLRASRGDWYTDTRWP